MINCFGKFLNSASDFAIVPIDLQSFVMSRDSPDLSVGSKYIMPWAHLMHSVVRMGGKTTGSHRISHFFLKTVPLRLQFSFQEPSFHMSIAWCVGNYVEQIQRDVLPQLQVAFQHFMHAQHDQWRVDVVQLHCKCGNKLSYFELAS